MSDQKLLMDKVESLESLLTQAITLPEKIDALNALAWELRFDDVLRAKSISESAYELATSLDDAESPYPKGLAQALRNLGHCHERLANYDVEISLLTESLSLFEQIADSSGQATVLYLMGSAYWSLGDYYHALERSLKSIEIGQEINDRFSLAKAWNLVGLVYQSIGDLAEALECFLKSLKIYEEIGDQRGQGDTLSNSCETALDLREYDKALTFGLRSLHLHEQLNYKDDLGVILTALGRVYLALQQPQQALYCLHRGLNISREGVNRYSELRCLLYLGEVYNQQGNRNLALSFIQQALPLAQEIETKQELYECYRILADIYKQEADFEKALAAHEQFHILKESVLNEVAKQKLNILSLVQQLEATRHKAEAQHLRNIELEREIMARQQAETALQASEDRLRHIFATLSDHIYVSEYTSDGRRINRYLSPIEALTGYSLEKLMADWSFWPSTIIHPDDQARAASQAQRFAQGQSSEMEYRLIRADGRVIWVRDSGRVEKDPHSGSLFVYGVVSDITARKQAETALRQSEARQRALLEAIPDLILRISRDGTYLDCKPARDFETIMPPRELIGKKVYDVLPFELARQRMQCLEQALQTRTMQTVEYQLQLNDHQMHYQEARFVTSGDDEVLLIVRDVTERKKIELERLRFTAQLRTAAEISKQVSAILDPKILLHYVVTLLQNRLNLYHVHIYLLNETDGELRVVAGSGEIGKHLEDYGHTISFEQDHSLVAQAARSQEIIWVADVSQEPNFLSNPLLPDTRTEVALPLIASGKVLGVLDVQESQVNYFTPSDVDTFSTLAGQIAIALDNARLYEATQREVIERKQAEEALREARDQLTARVDELETLNFVIRTITTTPDLETALTIVPQTMVKLFNGQRSGVALLSKAGTELKVVAEYRQDENEPSTVGEVIPISPELYDSQTFQNGQGVALSQAAVDPLTAPVHDMLQRIRTDQLMIVPLLVKGQVIGTIGVDRPYNDPEFTAAEMKLAETIAGQIAGAIEITRLLNEEFQLRQAAEVASEFKSQLLARVSHELRTPLGSILGYSELLHEGVFGPITADQKQAAIEIMESTYYLTSLVNELLDQAQYERGNLELHLAPMSIQDLVSQIESRMMIFARRKQLNFSFEIDPELPLTLVGDQKRLQQVLINLVSNAIKFTKAGQVKVRLFKASPIQWIMEVADTGYGIGPEAQEFIFEPFRQADGSITRTHGGTGLGLAIVKQLTTLMGGQVILESEIGKGSTFRVILPLDTVREKTYDKPSGLNH